MTISSAMVSSLASLVGAPEAGLRLILGQMAGACFAQSFLLAENANQCFCFFCSIRHCWDPQSSIQTVRSLGAARLLRTHRALHGVVGDRRYVAVCCEWLHLSRRRLRFQRTPSSTVRSLSSPPTSPWSRWATAPRRPSSSSPSSSSTSSWVGVSHA